MATIVLLVVLVVVVLWVIGAYNRLIALKNQVANAWKQIDVQLKRRHDLIPNLVETVKGYAAHERGTFEAVTQARRARGPASHAGEHGLLGTDHPHAGRRAGDGGVERLPGGER